MGETAAELVRNARRRSGLSQAALARRAGTTQSSVSAYETGDKDPTVETLARVLEAAGERLTPALSRSRGRGRVRLTTLRKSREQINAIAQHHGARNVRVFGSVARGTERRGSDVDFLVDFDRGRSLFDHIALTRELRALLNVDVDVVSSRALQPRDAAIRRDAVPL